MPFRRLRAKLLPPLRPGELRGAVWSFLYFFCVLTAYYILRPVREARGVGVGVQWLPALYAGTLLTLLLVTPLWGALLARVPRGRLLPWSYRCFALVLVGTAPLHHTLAAAHKLKVPGLLVQLTLLAYRYAFLLADEMKRLRIAMRTRGLRR